MIVIQFPRSQLSQFQLMDAQEVFGCITTAIVRFTRWEPPSWSEYVARCEKRVQAPGPNKFSFVIRRLDNRECLGMAGLEDADSVSPEIGLWLKKARTGKVLAGKSWPHLSSGTGNARQKEVPFIRAVQNTASRRIAEKLYGEIIGNRTNPKYDSVVYRSPYYELPYSPFS
jgi:RimJ/RimL family protein N-acetyltransferase